jgi:hypothetical protein
MMEQHIFMKYKSEPIEGSSKRGNRTSKKIKNGIFVMFDFWFNP